jgi:hypothetical protein
MGLAFMACQQTTSECMDIPEAQTGMQDILPVMFIAAALILVQTKI